MRFDLPVQAMKFGLIRTLHKLLYVLLNFSVNCRRKEPWGIVVIFRTCILLSTE